jgi:hypothetical protein
MSEFVRAAIQVHLDGAPKIDLTKPLVDWTPTEKALADEVLQIHTEEDR